MTATTMSSLMPSVSILLVVGAVAGAGPESTGDGGGVGSSTLEALLLRPPSLSLFLSFEVERSGFRSGSAVLSGSAGDAELESCDRFLRLGA